MFNAARQVHFSSDNRYATDSGPFCPKCWPNPADYLYQLENATRKLGETIWVFWVYPGQSSTAQCVTCHHAMSFMAPGHTRSDGLGVEWPTIHEVKQAFTETRKDM